MKTQGMAHQLEALRRMAGRDCYALFMEQGTGKTWTLLADLERLHSAGKVNAALVIAPKGVHTNWVLREIPAHLATHALTMAWRAGAGKRVRAERDRLLRPRIDGDVVPLRILAMNYDALGTKDGFDFARRFINATRAVLILDESRRIKNPSSQRTRRVMALRPHAAAARIASGTPITNAPLDVFAQMEFLEHGLLGTTSYRSFVAEYSEVLPQTHPMVRRLVERNPNAAMAQIIARDPDGSPRYRNLERLAQLLEPHSFRVLKSECLDLPEKIYKQMFFDMTPQQVAAYRLLEDELRIQLEDDEEFTTVSALAALVKLQQITSGFVHIEGHPVSLGPYARERMKALIDVVEDLDGKFIVWARFREELRLIAEALQDQGIEVVEYHGGVSVANRELAVDSFQNGSARAFVGQPQSGGIGLTLHAAETVIYYSNDFDLEHRIQSEDRAHRIGTKHNVVYIDIIATDTIDETIARALQRKMNVAAAVLGDKRKASARSASDNR